MCYDHDAHRGDIRPLRDAIHYSSTTLLTGRSGCIASQCVWTGMLVLRVLGPRSGEWGGGAGGMRVG